MRVEVAAAERRREVRRSARSWEKRGAIDSETSARIVTTYSDDRFRTGPVFRVLFFVFTAVAVFSAFGLLILAETPWGGLLFFMSIACLTATELQMGRYKRSGSGTEEATAFLAVVFFTAALAWLLIETTDDLPWRTWAFLTASAWALAAWRWGSWPYGAFAVISLLGMSTFLAATRPLWFMTALLLAPVLLSLSLSARTSPSQRSACDAALLVLLTAVYLTVHIGSYDSQLLEGSSWARNRGFQIPLPGSWFFVAGTALVPILALAAGIRWRLPIFFRIGVLFAVVSAITLRFYVHVAPLWVVLILCGVATIAAALLLRRYLGSGPGRERRGFTADPLDESLSRTSTIEMGLVTALEPDAPETPDPDAPSFGEGGEFGGGGAGRKF